MKKYYYDLHIHSVLSPCADELMTPQNIFNMAMLKHLDIISVTDHNSLKQIPVCYELSKSYDMLFIPGVEVTVSEGFDILIYFKHMKDTLPFDAFLSSRVKHIPNNNQYLKQQEIYDINDHVCDIYPYLLNQKLEISMDELIKALKSYECMYVFAHIDRYFDEILPYISKYKPHGIETRKALHLFDAKHMINSDAHHIIDILERDKNHITLDTCSLDDFFRYFLHG